MKQELDLGCGLIRIGRVWGVENKSVPSESEAINFLESAYGLGIRFFDTAPAYGLSELRLGKFLAGLSIEQRSEILVATKFGEHWDSNKQEPYVDHTYESLVQSLELSLEILGQIDLLQLHKTTRELLENEEVSRALESAKGKGIKSLGASISDNQTGLAVCEDGRFDYVQLPYNLEKTDLKPVIDRAKDNGLKVIFNRPFAMGGLVGNLQSEEEKLGRMKEAYRFVAVTGASGVLLTGTSSVAHLKENLEAFGDLQI